MAGFRQPELPRGQQVLWSQRLDETVPVDHPVRLFDQLLRSSALAGTFAAWENEYVRCAGQPPYHPRDLAGLYLYGLLNRLRSSRQLEAACYNRLDVLWLLQRQTPDHATIAAFVRDHRPRLRQLFRDVVQVGLRAELIRLEHTAHDGTKIEADAGRGSVHKDTTLAAELAVVDTQLAALEAEWAANEQREGAWFGAETPWAPPGQASARQRLAALERKQAALRQALAQIERRQAEAGPRGCQPIGSTTDPDSRCMKDKEGRRKPNYNAQLTVDEAAGLIVAAEVSDQPQDVGQLTPALAQAAANCGRRPQAVTADSGYTSGPELAALEASGQVVYLPDSDQSAPRSVPPETQAARAAVAAGQPLTAAQWAGLPRDQNGRLMRAAFVYEAGRDVYRCPAGQSLGVVTTHSSQRAWGRVVRTRYGFRTAPPCAACAWAGQCCARPERGRRLDRDQYEGQRERMRARLESAAGQALYRRRKATVEPRIGYLKQALGVRRFLHRGLAAVRAEWLLVCTAANIGVLLRHWTQVVPVL